MVVEPVSFTVGPVSQGAAAILAGGTAAYAGLTAMYAVRAFRARLEDRASAVLAALVMMALAWILFQYGAEWIPAPFSVALVVVYAAAIAFTLTYTLGRYQEKIEHFKETFGKGINALLADVIPEEQFAEWQRLRSSWRLGHEERRKAPHLLMGLFLIIYGIVGYGILRGAWNLGYGGSRAAAAQAGEGIQNLYAASHGTFLAAGQIFGVWCLLGLLYVILPTELLRLKYPELGYPFKAIIVSRLRKRETGLFGAHYYITATVALVAIVLGRDSTQWDRTIPAFLAVLSVSVFADSASALVGTRWGRTKWFHNPNKSYLGSFGGTVCAFAVALPFVGVPMAVVSAAAFLLVDFLAPVPFSVSDNILNPLALTVCYVVLQGYLDPMIPYY